MDLTIHGLNSREAQVAEAAIIMAFRDKLPKISVGSGDDEAFTIHRPMKSKGKGRAKKGLKQIKSRTIYAAIRGALRRNDGRLKKARIRQYCVDKGYDPTSVGPACTEMMRGGFIRKLGKGYWALV